MRRDIGQYSHAIALSVPFSQGVSMVIVRSTAIDIDPHCAWFSAPISPHEFGGGAHGTGTVPTRHELSERMNGSSLQEA